MGVHVLDTLVNFVSRLGTSADKNTYNRYAFNELDRRELELAYRGDWIARKVVNIPAQDATREWRAWQADNAQIETLEAEETRLGLQRKVKLAMIRARLYGGSALVMGVSGNPSEELVPDSVQRGDLRYVHVVSRHEIRALDVVRDVTSPLHGEPSWYEVTPDNHAAVRIHPSRVVRFLGNELPDLALQTSSEGWGDSVLQALDDVVKNVAVTSSGVAALVNEAKMDVLKIPNFMANIGTEEYKSRMLARLSLVNTSKSLMSTVLTDKEEEWQRIQTSFGALPDILRLYLMIACGAADIPSLRFLGHDSGATLGSTGESSVRNYYDSVSSHQRTEITPTLSRLDEVLLRSALGTRPPNIYYEWGPLWQMSDIEKADIAVKKASVYKSDVDTATLDQDVLAKGRLNQLVEDGVYPGIEEAIDKSGNDGIAEVDPNVQAQFAASKKNTQDAEPRSLYVSRTVVNADEIVAWAKSVGFDKTLPPEDMHVTVVFSRAKIDWMKFREDGLSMGPLSDKIPEGGLYVAPGGPRLVERLGPSKDVVVLMFASSALCWRHESVQQGGASWDWPEYQPHVTISFSVPQSVDVSKIEPYRGEIVLGPEIWEEVSEDWREGVREQ